MVSKSTAIAILSAAIGLCVSSLALPPDSTAHAAEVRLLCANGAKSIVVDLIAKFERTTGNTVSIGYGGASDLRLRIQSGEAFDVVVLPALEQFSAFEVARGSVTQIARSDFGIGMRGDRSKFDTSSPEGLRQLLLRVKSIAYTDPSTGGASGVLFARMIEKLGIAEEINKKSRLTFGIFNSTVVAESDAELAIQFAHELLAVPDIQFHPVPAEFGGSIIFSAGMSTRTKQPDAAKALIKLLSSAAAAPVILAGGMQPN